MKKIMFPLSVLFLILSFQIASAQEKKFEFLVGGGIDSPLGPDQFTDEFNLGWTAKLAAGYFVAPQFTLGANVSYNRFGFDQALLLQFKTMKPVEATSLFSKWSVQANTTSYQLREQRIFTFSAVRG